MVIPDDSRRARAAGRVVPLVGAGVSMTVAGPDGRPVFPGGPQRLESARPAEPDLGPPALQ